MNEWWDGLSTLNRIFFGGAVFSSIFFIWQALATIIGMDGDGADADMDADADLDLDHTYDDFEGGAESDALESAAAFRLLSLRSIVMFFTAFTWTGALYLQNGFESTRAIAYAFAWGFSGMCMIALMLWGMKRMAESGNRVISTCLGTEGIVYLNIPADGVGEAKVTISGVVTHVKARAVGGKELSANTPIKVTKTLGHGMVEVEPLTQNNSKEEVS